MIRDEVAWCNHSLAKYIKIVAHVPSSRALVLLRPHFATSIAVHHCAAHESTIVPRTLAA